MYQFKPRSKYILNIQNINLPGNDVKFIDFYYYLYIGYW